MGRGRYEGHASFVGRCVNPPLQRSKLFDPGTRGRGSRHGNGRPAAPPFPYPPPPVSLPPVPLAPPVLVEPPVPPGLPPVADDPPVPVEPPAPPLPSKPAPPQETGGAKPIAVKRSCPQTLTWMRSFMLALRSK